MSSVPALQPESGTQAPPEPELVKIREMIYEVAGIFHPDNKLGLLQDRCGRRMRNLNVQTLQEYRRRLTNGPIRQAELNALLNEITIGETCFFRNQEQLDALWRIVIPSLLQGKAKLPSRRLRIWSAGCSTGEEPYTLRMLLLEETGFLKDWSIEIFATDLNERSLAHASQGMYDNHSTRKLTPNYRSKYFLPCDDRLRLAPVVRSGIRFRRLNLLDEAGMRSMKDIDIILCCNVLIYFDLLSKRRVIEHFYNSLPTHGYLCLGGAESLYGVSDDFRLVHLPGTTAYVKVERPRMEAKSV